MSQRWAEAGNARRHSKPVKAIGLVNINPTIAMSNAIHSVQVSGVAASWPTPWVKTKRVQYQYSPTTGG